MQRECLGSRTTGAGWSASLVAERAGVGWRDEAKRLGLGLGLASLYGAALGARYGVAAMAAQALGVPLGFVAVAALAAPAFYILLAHTGHPVGALGLAAAVSRAIAVAGLVLAAVAPAALLLTVSVEAPLSAALCGLLGLGLGGGLGLRSLFGQLGAELTRAGAERPLAGRLVTAGFACFAALLAARVWWLAVPSLGGGS